MFSLSNPEIRFAVEAVCEAIPLARQIQKEMAGESLTKSDESPVTVADFSIQALIAHRLSQAFPHDPLLAEESSRVLKKGQGTVERVAAYVRQSLPQATPEKIYEWIDHGASGSSDRFWTLDPIDGTKGFLRGAQYVVALALIEKGKVQLGVLGCPHLKNGCEPDLKGQGSIVIAVRGQGTWAAPVSDPKKFRPLKVTDHRSSQDAALLGSVESAHTDKTKLRKLLQALGAKSAAVLMDSQAKYAALAGGRGDFFLYFLPEKKPDYRMKIWDVAPGAILVEEAGGRVSDLLGNPIDFSCGGTLQGNPGLLATNGHLHPIILQELKKIL